MNKGLEVEITGIKCDVCDYRDDTVEFKDYSEWLNKPCPKCDSNLLTQKDYDSCLRIYRNVNMFNKIIRPLRWINPFYYFRLIFGDRRIDVTLTKKY